MELEDKLSFENVPNSNLIDHSLAGAEAAIRSLQRKMLTGLSEDEVLDSVFKALEVFIPFDRVSIALREGELLRAKWIKSRVKAENLNVGYSAKIEGSSLKPVLETGKARVIDDLELYLRQHPDSRSTALIVKDGMRSSLTFPLQLDGESFGVVFFSSCSGHAYTAEHLELLESVAQGLSLVVERTRLREMRQNAKNQEKMLSKIVHDLRSPLSVMVGFTDLINDSVNIAALDKPSQNAFSVIRRNAKTMLTYVDELSDIETIHSNQFSIHANSIGLRDYISEVAQCLRPLCAAKNISFKYQIDEDVPATWVLDPIRIRQVLENLVSNAAKFSNPGTGVKMRIRLDNGCLCFSIADQGPGIADEDLPKLFQEYGVTRVKPTAGEESTGLGLAICKQIVEAHHGKIGARNQQGPGAIFEFFIPQQGSE